MTRCALQHFLKFPRLGSEPRLFLIIVSDITPKLPCLLHLGKLSLVSLVWGCLKALNELAYFRQSIKYTKTVFIRIVLGRFIFFTERKS